MVLSCAVQNCVNKSIKGNGIIFHRLPLHDKELLEKWLKALKIDDWTPTKYYNICSGHFKENDYKKSPSGDLLTDLKCTAIPSFLADNSHPKHKTYSSTNKRKSSNIKQLGKKKKNFSHTICI